MARHVAVLLSGGVGNRMGLDVPKQYVIVGGKPIIYYSLKALLEHKSTDALVVVVSQEWKQVVIQSIDEIPHHIIVMFADPGSSRQLSILSALQVIKDAGYYDDDIVLVHEAARPMVRQELIDACYECCEEADCVVPVMPVKNTLYYSEDGRIISSLIDRSKVWSGQAPEAFRFGRYYQANIDTPKDVLALFNGGTELAFYCGLSCRLIEGDPFNFKITTQEDLTHFRSIIGDVAQDSL